MFFLFLYHVYTVKMVFSFIKHGQSLNSVCANNPHNHFQTVFLLLALYDVIESGFFQYDHLRHAFEHRSPTHKPSAYEEQPIKRKYA